MHYRNQKTSDSAIWLKYDDDDYPQRYGQVKEVFRALAKDKILKPYISDHDFRSTNVIAAGEATNDIIMFHTFSINDIKKT